ncbi:MAG TPA: hypothetical protein VK588_03980, partial [Chitinophagaceae bacterium]|nr:hypothetical protein [Chitinophagaceae bacterium]
GTLQTGDTRVPYELVISGKKNSLKGYSLLVFTFKGVENVGIKTMDIDMKRASIAIEDGDLIYDNYTTPSRRVKLYGSLVWVGRDSNMTLNGTFSTRSMDMRAPNENAFKGTIFLQRKNNRSQTRLVSKLTEMNLAGTLSFGTPSSKEISTSKNKENITQVKEIKTPPKPEPVARKTEIIRAVSFHSDSLVLSLYDNGEIDGDTVSIILNGKVLISKQGLTAKAITKTVYASDLNDSSVLVMYAENLGRIPPNTGLLVLQDGNERYQIRFSGDLQNNSAIILRRKR